MAPGWVNSGDLGRLAAVVGQPDAYAGELPVAYVQLKPGATHNMSDLMAYLKEHTPERAAVPVALHPVDPMPLTAVGKIFKPALRVDAMRRVAERLLEGLGDLSVEVLPHATHGQVIRVRLSAAAGIAADAIEAQVHARLDPLTVRHEVLRG